MPRCSLLRFLMDLNCVMALEDCSRPVSGEKLSMRRLLCGVVQKPVTCCGHVALSSRKPQCHVGVSRRPCFLRFPAPTKDLHVAQLPQSKLLRTALHNQACKRILWHGNACWVSNKLMQSGG